MAKKNLTRNFQRGSTGRDKGDKTFTFKARSKDGTKAYNIRCDANRTGEPCRVAVAIYKEIQHSLANKPDDNDAKRKIVKAKK